MLPERGIVSFIRMKLSSGVSPYEIKNMLLRAGFHNDNIDHAFRFVKEKFPDSQIDINASKDFLPEISKNKNSIPTHPVKMFGKAPAVEKNIHAPVGVSAHAHVHPHVQSPVHEHTHAQLGREMGRMFRSASEKHFKTHAGLFCGRLRRKDFTLGFLFFFSVGYVILSLTAVVISFLSPELWQVILAIIERDTNGVLLLTIPVILAPITVMMLSLITRRLHNLGLPGSLSWLFLVLFIPLDIQIFYGMWYIYLALGILFVLLLSQKGSPEPNQYGELPASKGSFFKRIFNV